MGLVLTLSFFSLFGQNSDSTSADTNFLFLQLETIELEGVKIISDSERTNAQIFNPIANNSTANMDEVLERIPQIQLVKRGSFAYEPQINSLSGGQISVSIDGMRIFGACTDKMDPSTSYIEPINLEKVEVSCHSNSSLDGSNVGGSLNLSTRKATFTNKFDWKGELNSTLNTNSLGRNFSGGLNLSSKKLALKVNGAIRKHDNYRAGGGEEVKYTQYEKQNFAFNFRARLGNKWIFDADYLYDLASDVGYAALPMDVAVAKTNLGSASFTGYDVIKGVEKIKIKAYVNQVYHQMDDSKRPDEEIDMRMDMPGWSNTYGGFASFKLKTIKKHNIELKADYYYNFRRAEMIMYDPDGGPDMFMLTWPDVVRNALGIAGVDKVEINTKNSVILSGRLDWTTTGIEDDFGKRQLTGFGYTGDEVYVHFPYSISTTWNRLVGKHYQLRWSVASSSRVPTTSEMYGYFLFNKEDGYDYIGKPDIKTEKSIRSSLELKRKANKVDWTTSVGYNRLLDYIYGVPDKGSSAMTIGGKGVKYYDNLPWAQILNFSLHAPLLHRVWVLNIIHLKSGI